MYLLVKKANLCGIINDNVAKISILKRVKPERKNEPSRIQREEPLFFMQLVFRAVSENEISVQKGAELLKQSHSFVAERCFAEERQAMEYISSEKNMGLIELASWKSVWRGMNYYNEKRVITWDKTDDFTYRLKSIK